MVHPFSSISQDVEITTRSKIAERTEFTFPVHGEDTHALRRRLDVLMRDIWADTLAETSDPSNAKTRPKMAENHTNDDQPGRDLFVAPKNVVFQHPIVFRLVSSMKHPQHISLDHRSPTPFTSRGPDCEDNEEQADVRRRRALSVAVDLKSLKEGAALKLSVDPKHVATKIPLAGTPLTRSLPPLLVTEEIRGRGAVPQVMPRILQASGDPAPSPHEPRPSCLVLPVISKPDRSETTGRKRRKLVKERPPPAYWRPSSDLRGKCMGYALGYPSYWAPDHLYVRDVLKRGVETTMTQ